MTEVVIILTFVLIPKVVFGKVHSVNFLKALHYGILFCNTLTLCKNFILCVTCAYPPGICFPLLYHCLIIQKLNHRNLPLGPVNFRVHQFHLSYLWGP